MTKKIIFRSMLIGLTLIFGYEYVSSYAWAGLEYDLTVKAARAAKKSSQTPRYTRERDGRILAMRNGQMTYVVDQSKLPFGWSLEKADTEKKAADAASQSATQALNEYKTLKAKFPRPESPRLNEGEITRARFEGENIDFINVVLVPFK